MRNFWIIIGLLIVWGGCNLLPAQAQITSKGIKAGVNVADFYGTDIDEIDQDSKTGVILGSFVTYNLNPLFALQPELLISMKGTTRKATSFNREEIYNLFYLEFPLLAKLTVPTVSAASPNLYLGPSFAVKLSDDLEVNGTTVNDANVKSSDFGLIMGGGIDYQIGYNKLIFELRYSLGLQKIDDSEASRDWKNRTVSVMMGYAF